MIHVALWFLFDYVCIACIHGMEFYIVNYNLGMADIYRGGGMLLLRLRRFWVG